MKRIEIIFSQSIEEDIFLALKPIPAAQFFSVIPGIRGRGYSEPKMNDSVWPEVNELMIIYCDDESVGPIRAAIDVVRGKFPGEGLAMFVL